MIINLKLMVLKTISWNTEFESRHFPKGFLDCFNLEHDSFRFFFEKGIGSLGWSFD